MNRHPTGPPQADDQYAEDRRHGQARHRQGRRSFQVRQRAGAAHSPAGYGIAAACSRLVPQAIAIGFDQIAQIGQQCTAFVIRQRLSFAQRPFGIAKRVPSSFSPIISNTPFSACSCSSSLASSPLSAAACIAFRSRVLLSTNNARSLCVCPSLPAKAAVAVMAAPADSGPASPAVGPGPAA